MAKTKKVLKLAIRGTSAEAALERVRIQMLDPDIVNARSAPARRLIRQAASLLRKAIAIEKVTQ